MTDDFDYCEECGIGRLFQALGITDTAGFETQDAIDQAVAAIIERDGLRIQLAVQTEVANNQTWWCVQLRKTLEEIKRHSSGDYQMIHSDRCDSIRLLAEEATPLAATAPASEEKR